METWLNSDISDQEVQADLPNFQIFRKDRDGRMAGGVLIAVSQGLPATLVNLSSDFGIFRQTWK